MIQWHQTLTREQIARILGAEWIAMVEALPRAHALAFCASRASGAWDANDRESHAAYRSLSILLAQ